MTAVIMGWAIAITVYLFSAIGATLIARTFVDPYGHFNPARDWFQAVLYGAFWPAWLTFVIGAMIYYAWFKRS